VADVCLLSALLISRLHKQRGYPHSLYEQMFHYFMFKREEYLQHYHKRSNVESTFSMMKRKFGDSLRSKTDTALVNETLCKVLCHNLVVLIHEMHELNITPVFWAN
jgi:transposase